MIVKRDFERRVHENYLSFQSREMMSCYVFFGNFKLVLIIDFLIF